MSCKLTLSLACAYLSLAGCVTGPRYDVVVYGGTSAGVIAAVKAARMGRSVVLIEPGQHLGGMSSSGLGATDIGNKAAIGGLAREFYRRVGAKYGQAEAWKFEPHVAEEVFADLVWEAGVPVAFGERLERRPDDAVPRLPPGTLLRVTATRARGVRFVKRAGGSGDAPRAIRIDALVMESGRAFRGRVFIDATYEGDLLAAAGVSYTIGRESNATYGETLNGVQVGNATKHQFVKEVDPYVVPGDPASGLLPGIEPAPPPPDGTGDHRVQAYNLRLCTTDVPENRRPWEKPADYDERKYELLLRNFDAGDDRVPWHRVMVPNRKTDTNNNFAISTDCIGMNYGYAQADYATRERVVREHRAWTAGLTWTLASHPRVPEHVRREFQTWGRARDEFTDNDNWPYQLYAREARRMVADYVMTEHDCQGRKAAYPVGGDPPAATDPVGLAAYGMDSHNVQRYVDEHGHVRNEGDVQVHGFQPYPISYRAIVPRRGECANLLVPVCVSATHIAYGSIRMEPVFMVLGESAATTAALACEAAGATRTAPEIHALKYERLAERLLADGQVLTWPPPADAPAPK
ncbi:MAG: FAD-dependent oxidoreductase [Planctomycetota bacterium]